MMSKRIPFRWLEGGILLLLLAVSFLLYLGCLTPVVPDKDSLENGMIALNLVQHGVYSINPAAEGERPEPTTKREPLYPVMLAAVMALVREGPLAPRHLTVEGYAAGFVRSIKVLNVFLLLCLVLASWWSARLFFRRWWPALAVAALLAFNTSFMSTLDEFLTEIPGALFVVTTSTLLFLAVTRRSKVFALLGGLSLGALILVKTAFLLLPFLLLAAAGIGSAAALLRRRRGRWPGFALFALAGLVALAVYAPWFVRTQSVARAPQLDNREEGILAIRAEYSTMSWKQYGASFVYFTPVVGPRLTGALFGDETLRRFDRSRPESFFQRAQGGTGVVARTAAAEQVEPRAAAIRVLARNLPKAALLTLPFAWRGAFVQVGFNLRNTPAPLIYTTLLVSVFFVPALVFMSARLLRRPFDPRASFLIPALYSYLAHSLFTHYIPRYSVPLIPVFIICLVGSVLAVAESVRGAREAARSIR